MRTIIFSNVNPLRAYSGLKYLTEALKQNGLDVELVAKIPRNMLSETTGWKMNVKSFYSSWYGKIPLFRRYMVHLHVLLLGIFADVLIFHEITFYREIVLLKKLFPKKKFIHYCTELYTEKDVPKDKNLLKFYKRYANIPDLIIECDEGREKLRKEMFGITKPTTIILNTIPKAELPSKGSKGSLAKLAGIYALPTDMPIVVYTGGAYFHRQLDMLVEAVSKVNRKVFFLSFCYGDKNAIDSLERLCREKLGSKYFKICYSVPRNDLLMCINEATAGIVYYKPSLSIGNLYASPTKLFEYIGAGIPVISSNNPEIVKLIEKYNLGVCVKDESVEALAQAIEDLVFDKEKITEIKKNEDIIFNNLLCYEVANRDAIKKIVDVIKK